MIFYSQTDSRWSGQLLGFYTAPPYTIGNYGCLITAWANLMVATSGNEQYTPEDVNAYLRAHGGFANQGEMVWATALAMGNVKAMGSSSSLPEVNNFLEVTPNFAIIEYELPNGNEHFCLANLVGQIVDSEDGREKSITSYPFVSAHLYTALSMPADTAASAAAPSLPSHNGVTYTPVNATVTITVPLLNARTEPNTSSPEAAQFKKGTAHVNGWTVGQEVTVGGRTDNIWLLSDAGHWFAQAGTSANE